MPSRFHPFLYLLFLLLTHNLAAQIEKGTLMPYGRVGLSATTSEGLNEVGLSLNPGCGKMVSNRLMIGLEPNVSIMLGDFKGLNYGLNSFARYYFNPEKEPVKWFIEAYGQFLGITNDFSDGTIFKVGAEAGFNYFLNPNVAFEAAFGPSYLNSDIFPDFNEVVNLGATASLVFLLDNNAKSQWRTTQSVIGKRDLMVGGSGLAAGYDSDLDTERFYVNAQPNVGFFLTDQWMIGAQLGLGLQVDASTLFSYQISPFARYYFRPEGRKRLFAFLRTGISDATGGEITVDPTFTADAGAGLDIFIAPTVALEGAAFLTLNPDANLLQLNVGLGFQIFLDNNRQ